jgi:hypothetical protein
MELNSEGRDDWQAERCPICEVERGNWPANGWQLHLDLCYTLAQSADVTPGLKRGGCAAQVLT